MAEPEVAAVFQTAAEAALHGRLSFSADIKDNEAAQTDVSLHRLARRAGLEIRRVRLRERAWWRFGIRPIIAFETAQRSPVALIPDRFGGYTRVDGSGNRARLTARSAKLLEPDAFMLYTRVPAGLRSLTDVVRHALASEKSSILVLAATVLISVIANAAFPFAAGRSTHGFAVLIAALVLSEMVRSGAELRLAGKLNVSLVPGIWGRVLRAGLAYFHATHPEEIALAAGSSGPVCASVGADAVECANALVAVVAVAVVLIVRCGAAGGAAAVAAFLLVAVRFTIRLLEHAAAESGETMEQDNFGLLRLIILDLPKLRLLRASQRLFDAYLACRRKAVELRRREYAWGACDSVPAALSPAVLLLPAVLAPLPASHVVSYLTGAALLVWNLQVIDGRSRSLLGFRSAARRLRPLLEAAAEPEAREKRGLRLRGAIELNDVSFAWPGAAEPALDHVSLSIQPGEFACIAGPSGSGKSTLIRLLLGLERPTHGEITWDGQPLDTLDLETVRSQIESVSQEERLIAGTIRMNIQGLSPLGLNDAWSAAHLACIADAIRAMPLGMMTFANENVFSTGESQRLFIARAIARRPAVLILDETLGGLDEDLQRRIIVNLRSIRGMSCIIASHRAGISALMDRTWRLDGGRVVGVESGKPVRAEPLPPMAPPVEPEFFLPEAVARFHAPEPLDRIVRLWPCR